MVSPLLAKAAPAGREIVNVTPERAGWTHVGFRAVRLATGETETVATGTRELCLVVLTGTVDVEVDGQTYPNLGGRKTVFEEVSPASVYVPSGKSVKISNAAGAGMVVDDQDCCDGEVAEHKRDDGDGCDQIHESPPLFPLASATCDC